MTRILVYTGKGGVGKTSVAAATALACADRGYRTIVMSTDIAHSLGDAFDRELGPTPVEIAPNLWAQESDVFFNVARAFRVRKRSEPVTGVVKPGSAEIWKSYRSAPGTGSQLNTGKASNVAPSAGDARSGTVGASAAAAPPAPAAAKRTAAKAAVWQASRTNCKRCNPLVPLL